MTKNALITGINGQDGSYLAELLLEKGYEVYGTIRRNSTKKTETSRIDHIINDLYLEYVDVTDSTAVSSCVFKAQPDEIYHLAAMSDVGISFDQPFYTVENITLGTLNLLEAAKNCGHNVKFYQASTSEIYGNNGCTEQTELTEKSPVSPYGIAKLAAYHFVQVYRRSYNMFASNGILFNHESPRRGENFVTAKIVKGAIDIYKGYANELHLGNLDSVRDWGHAKDYVQAMYLILQHDKPDDFVCATNIIHTVRDVCDYVFKSLDLGDYQKFVKSTSPNIRPLDLVHLKGNPSKAETELGWKREYTFETLLDEMIKEKF
jgi:GDPmannose 4,6-dehydratase